MQKNAGAGGADSHQFAGGGLRDLFSVELKESKVS